MRGGARPPRTFLQGIGSASGIGKAAAVDDDLTIRGSLQEAMGGVSRGLAQADRLCVACVDLLGVDGAAVSVIHEGSSRGTFGSSGELSRDLEDFQFTFGEGPCLEASRRALPVLVADLSDPGEARWPAYGAAVLQRGIRAIFALPVVAASVGLGSLDLYRHGPGPLSIEDMAGALVAAELAALPLLDLMTADVDWGAIVDDGDHWEQLASLERVEVYQATGMIMGQLGVGPAEALVRIRAHAFVSGRSASEVAWSIIEQRLTLEADAGGTAREDPESGGAR